MADFFINAKFSEVHICHNEKSLLFRKKFKIHHLLIIKNQNRRFFLIFIMYYNILFTAANMNYILVHSEAESAL